MPVEFFQVPLSIQPKARGEAELVPPKVLKNLNYQFVIIKEGGEEGVIQIDVPQKVLTELEKDKTCQKLTTAQLEELKKTYQAPKLKQKYRFHLQSQQEQERAVAAELYELDEQGARIIDTFQTFRSGFYLIDVPVITPTS